MAERQIKHCPKVDNCLDANGKERPVCLNSRESEGYYDKMPLVPAERLCLTALQNHRESRAKNNLTDTYNSVCFDIDHSLATPNVFYDEHGDILENKTPYKNDLIRQTIIQLSNVPNLERVKENELWAAMQLKRIAIFMPAFRMRANEHEVSADLVGQTHSGLVEHIATLEKIQHGQRLGRDAKKQIGAHLAECEIMALLTRHRRPELFPYPALIREESSHARKQANHDFYTLSKDRKRPVQVKTSSNGSGYVGVAVIQHYDILRSMKREPEKHKQQWTPPRTHEDFEWPSPYTYEAILTGKTPDHLSALLIEEKVKGKRLERHKREALNLASSYVIARIR